MSQQLSNLQILLAIVPSAVLACEKVRASTSHFKSSSGWVIHSNVDDSVATARQKFGDSAATAFFVCFLSLSTKS